MYILFSENMKNKVKRIGRGSIKCIAIFNNETGEVCEVVNNTSECYSYMQSHNTYDETIYASVLINCNEVFNLEEGRLQI